LNLLNENIVQKFTLRVLFLGLIFCKSLGFFLSELVNEANVNLRENVQSKFDTIGPFFYLS
jgi:hypothetical protein